MMTFTRLWQSFRVCLIRGNGARADYLRKHGIYGAIGENCAIKRRKIPLYANLIRIGDNVRLGSVTFLTHDMTHKMLNGLDRVKKAGGVQEKIGCIEIGSNVFVGSNTIILYDTKIGSNVIIAAGSVVTHDIPDNSIVAGVPARVIGKFDDFVEKRLRSERYPEELRPNKQAVSDELAKYLWDRFGKTRE